MIDKRKSLTNESNWLALNSSPTWVIDPNRIIDLLGVTDQQRMNDLPRVIY